MISTESVAIVYRDSDRRWYLVVLSLASSALMLARKLEPSPLGIGTHEQLGLPPCPFFKLIKLPCPSCGLTTSFAHAVHWNFYESLIAQPFGLILFCVACIAIPLSCYLMYRRVPWERIIHGHWSNLVMYTFIALYFLSWGYKIMAMNFSNHYL